MLDTMAKVHSTTVVIPIESSNVQMDDDPNCCNIELRNETPTVEKERSLAEIRAAKRMKKFKQQDCSFND